MNTQRTEKELILATKPFASEFRARSWWAVGTTLLLLIFLYLGIFMGTPMWLKILFSVFCGLTLVRMFVIYHDHQHKAILQRSKLAEYFFACFGVFILAPNSIWSRSHDYHHAHNSKLYTSSIGSFPIVTSEKYLSMKKGEQNMYLFIRHPLTIALGYIFAFIWGMCIKSFLSNGSKHWDSIIALVLHIGIGGVILTFFGWKMLLIGLIIPHSIACAIGAYLFYAQHNFPGATFEEKDGWTYVGAALKSSSYMVLSPFWRWVTANIGYHHIHHLNARIPFYRLPEVFNSMPELQHPKTTSLDPREILRCFRLKVWDPQQGKMVGLK